MGVALKDTEAAFIEFYCLNLIALLSTLGDIILLCLWCVVLIVCLINLQFENIAKYCCVVVGSGECMCKPGEGGEKRG